MGEFRKATDEAKAIFAALSEGMDGERKPMFGCPCLFHRGNMISGTYADRIFFRIPRAEQGEVVEAHPGVGPFEPMAGRPMRDYLDMEAVAANRGTLSELLARSWAQAQDLPPKTKMTKKA